MATFIPDTATFLSTLAFDIDVVSTRAGFAGDGEPRTIFPSCVCTGLPSASATGAGASEGWAVLEQQHDAHLSAETLAQVRARPLVPQSAFSRAPNAVQAAAVDEWVLRALLQHGLHALGGSSWAEHPLLLSEPTSASAASRRQAAEMAFEDLGVPALCIVRTAELAAVSAMRANAVVLEVGDEGATAAVLSDGAVVPRSVHSSHLGGFFFGKILAQVTAGLTGKLEPRCALRGVECTPSLLEHRMGELRRDFCESVCRCADMNAAARAGSAKAARTGRSEAVEYK
jgi:actin-related protein